MADLTENRISPHADAAIILLNSKISLTSAQQLKLSKLQADVSLNPADDNLLVQRAQFYLAIAKTTHNKSKQKQIFQLALADYDCAIKLAKHKAAYFSERADINYSLRRFDAAMADCLQAKKIAPTEAGYQAKLLKFKCLQRKLAAVKRLRRIRYGVEIMVMSFLFALIGTFIWGTGATIYAIPFIAAALAIFFIGFIEVLANETKMYQTRKGSHSNTAMK